MRLKKPKQQIDYFIVVPVLVLVILWITILRVLGINSILYEAAGGAVAGLIGYGFGKALKMILRK